MRTRAHKLSYVPLIAYLGVVNGAHEGLRSRLEAVSADTPTVQGRECLHVVGVADSAALAGESNGYPPFGVLGEQILQHLLTQHIVSVELGCCYPVLKVLLLATLSLQCSVSKRKGKKRIGKIK